MNWQEVIEKPELQDLPFRIELTETGQIVMTPVTVLHAAFQGEFEHLLRNLKQGGLSLPECAVATRKGTKVADVAWFSYERFARIHHETEAPIAPEICVEIISASNTAEEMRGKALLFFEKEAEEFWLCAEEGQMSFYNQTGQLTRSLLVPDFPANVEFQAARRNSVPDATSQGHFALTSYSAHNFTISSASKRGSTTRLPSRRP